MKRAVITSLIMALSIGGLALTYVLTSPDYQYSDRYTIQEQSQNNKPEPSKYDVGPPDATEMWELTNEERRKAGLPPMALDPRLNASAQEKANDMAVRDYYGHKSPEGTQGYSLVFKHMPGKCQYASENLANTPPSIGHSRRAIDGWMDSTKGHREAILDKKYGSVGFGVAKDKHGLFLVVQHFCQPK